MISRFGRVMAFLLLVSGTDIVSAAQPTFLPSDYLVLSAAQEQLLWQMVAPRDTNSVRPVPSVRVSLDIRAPNSILLHPMPPGVIERLPTLTAYEYGIHGQSLLIVNPADNMIVDIISPQLAGAGTAAQSTAP